MILIYGLALGLAAFQASPPQDDPAAALRRLAATATLAAQEYRIGVRDGKIVAQAEVDEAVLFLQEAVRATDGLPVQARERARGDLDSALVLVRSLADPEMVSAHVLSLTTSLSETMGIALDLVPSSTPSLAGGGQIYQQQCASCHGSAGIGDGSAATGLDPPPADLTDALRLANQTPLDFYRRITIGVAGTAMTPYEDVLDENQRWAVALYASSLRLPEPAGEVPPHLWWFERTARLSDEALRRELTTYGSDSSAGAVAAVRSHPGPLTDLERATATLALVGVQLDSAYALAMNNRHDAAGSAVLDAYVTFEGVEPAVRARNPGLAAGLEGAFATFRGAVSATTPPLELRSMKGELSNQLVIARRALDEPVSRLELFLQSFLILLREGVEAILIVGALIAFLVKTGAGDRRRDVYIGVVAAVAASLLTAVLIETIFHISTAQQELLEGVTMLVAAVVLFYVSYWLLSKMEVARWNQFVSGKIKVALAGGSLLALPMVAFLAVYREGFETVLFYKALLVSSDVTGAVLPVVGGMLAAGVVLGLVYLAISRFGVRVPLKPFFGLTGAFLYYMAFVFAGKGVLELQGAGLVSATYLSWAPEIPALGAYRTLEGFLVQSLLLVLFGFGLLWSFVIEPRRLKVTSVLVPDLDPEPVGRPRVSRAPLTDLIEGDKNLVRSLNRMDADLAEIRAEIARIKEQMTVRSQSERS